jgi:purine-nucleoside phosphorylase
MSYLSMIGEARDFIKDRIGFIADLAVILGTGLGTLADHIDNKIVIKYSEVPYFPISTVPGHAGEFIIGDIGNKKVMAMKGRFHFYEGYDMKQVTFPVRVIKALGVNKIIVTNASGGMNANFKAGDLMIISDHINMLGTNPLIGPNFEELGPRFPDMSEAYNREYIILAEETAARLNIDIQKGVYVAVTGPNYETPAELKMFIKMGADAVGMSTIPEVIVAKHGGMKVMGISCITDMALPDSLEPLDHEKVVATADMATEKFVSLVKEIIPSM